MPNLPAYVYLVGPSNHSFENKLPRGIDVLRYYFHFECNDEAKKISETSIQIQQVYQDAGISIIHFESIRSKVKRLISSVRLVIETRKSKGPSQKQKELAIHQKLVQLFEITKDELLLSSAKRDFLQDQRTVRLMVVNRSSTSVRAEQHLPSTSNQNSSVNESHLTSNHSEVDPMDSLYSPELDFDDSPDFIPFDSGEEKCRRRIKLCDTDIRDLSKSCGSYRVMEKVLKIGIKTAGGNPNDYAISKTSLCDQMNSQRSSAKTDIAEQIASSEEKVVIHFDEKSFQKINAKHLSKESRMVVMCHTRTKDISLGLPILLSRQAETLNNELIGLCENHNLLHRVVCLMCDTTAVNTGEWGGVCVLFEKELQKDLLKPLCRHHILELLLMAAFKTAVGAVEAPTISIFNDLKENWQFIKDRGFRYQACDELELESPELEILFHEAKNALINHAASKLIRDDYAELIDLCLKFFGIRTKKSFMVPGSMSKARWMAKAIYGMKMFLFREDLNLDADFEHQLMEFALFVSIIYCKHWNRSTNIFDAPVNDLTLIKELREYSIHNADVANAVLATLKNHLWYLGEELSVFSLFSDKVTNDEKNRMRLRFTSRTCPERSENSVRLRNFNDGLQLSDLITNRSRFVFCLLDLDTTFLLEKSETWNSNKNYKKARKIIQDLIPVVNDLAERALGRATQIIKSQKVRSEARLQNMFLSLYD